MGAQDTRIKLKIQNMEQSKACLPLSVFPDVPPGEMASKKRYHKIRKLMKLRIETVKDGDQSTETWYNVGGFKVTDENVLGLF